MKTLLIFLLCLPLCFMACSPEADTINPNPPASALAFSGDTVLFDTVFTTLRTTTRRLVVYNNDSKALAFSSIAVAGGGNSPYKVVINGKRAQAVQNMELRGGDSLLVLVEATINALDQNLPFIVKDSLVFEVKGGTTKNVKLVAWGQDAHFLRGGQIACDQTWDNDKPYVVYDSVVVGSACTLTINEGTRVHFASRQAKLLINGRLLVKGSTDKPVSFQGLRLDKAYEEIPNQWNGLVLANGSESRIDYAIIKNGQTGLLVGTTPNSSAKLLLNNSVVKNMANTGLLVMGGTVEAYNCLLYDCAQNLVNAENGGSLMFWQNTFAYSGSKGFQRSTPAVSFAKPFVENPVSPSQLEFVNNIVTGPLFSEIELPKSLNNSLIKNNVMRTFRADLDTSNRQLPQNLIFNNPFVLDFRLDTALTTVADDRGLPLTGHPRQTILNHDITNHPRDLTKPDIGAYEKRKK